jgi:hypothetical protein
VIVVDEDAGHERLPVAGPQVSGGPGKQGNVILPGGGDPPQGPTTTPPTTDSVPYRRRAPCRTARHVATPVADRTLSTCVVCSLDFVKGETEYEAGFAEQTMFPLHHHCLMGWSLEAG